MQLGSGVVRKEFVNLVTTPSLFTDFLRKWGFVKSVDRREVTHFLTSTVVLLPPLRLGNFSYALRLGFFKAVSSLAVSSCSCPLHPSCPCWFESRLAFLFCLLPVPFLPAILAAPSSFPLLSSPLSESLSDESDSDDDSPTGCGAW